MIPPIPIFSHLGEGGGVTLINNTIALTISIFLNNVIETYLLFNKQYDIFVSSNPIPLNFIMYLIRLDIHNELSCHLNYCWYFSRHKLILKIRSS